jgi:hypothetical protein
MTRMSDPRSIVPGAPCPNYLQSQEGSRLARRVQAGRSGLAIEALLLMMLCAALVGCVIPPSLRPEDDAGTDSPPAILTVSGDRTAFAEPGPVVLEQGSTASTLNLHLLDTDVDDDLYVRLFVDYNAPDRLPPRIACNVPHTGKPLRDASCNVSGLCMTADIGVQRNLSIVVSDRKPDDFGADPQHLDSSGVSTDRFYFLQCQPPQTP